MGNRCADHVTPLYPQKLALTSPTGGGRSVGIVRSRTKATEFSLGIMHPRCCRPATSWVHYTTSCNTQSSPPEDGWNHLPKHVELIGIINKPLLLHLVGCLHVRLMWRQGLSVRNVASAIKQQSWIFMKSGTGIIRSRLSSKANIRHSRLYDSHAFI